MRMGFPLLLCWAMRCVRIGLVGALLPNCPVANYRRVVSIVLAIGWTVLIVHLFEGDTPWTRFVSFLSSDRNVSGIVT